MGFAAHGPHPLPRESKLEQRICEWGGALTRASCGGLRIAAPQSAGRLAASRAAMYPSVPCVPQLRGSGAHIHKSLWTAGTGPHYSHYSESAASAAPSGVWPG